MTRTVGADAKILFRVVFQNTETGHNWFEGPYTTYSAAKALKSRKSRRLNKELAKKGEKPAITGRVQSGRIVRWEDSPENE